MAISDSTLTTEYWSECYPPDYDHGGEPLLGPDPSAWFDLLNGVAFFGAECSLQGEVVVVVARVRDGFVEVHGQCVSQGQTLSAEISDVLSSAALRIPVDRFASATLGLDLELDELPGNFDSAAVARRMEIHLLSTIATIAASENPPAAP